MVSAIEVDNQLKPLLLKDLRIQCRARGLNPGGNREALLERVGQNMLETGDITLATEFNGEVAFGVPQPAANRADQASLGAIGINNNNYIRSDGQNVGNFITDRPSSRVLAPPGGATSWSFGDAAVPETVKSPAKSYPVSSPAKPALAASPVAPASPASDGRSSDDLIGAGNMGAGNNNYTRPSGQNVGNFITGRPSSRVLAPPGGTTSWSFGQM